MTNHTWHEKSLILSEVFEILQLSLNNAELDNIFYNIYKMFNSRIFYSFDNINELVKMLSDDKYKNIVHELKVINLALQNAIFIDNSTLLSLIIYANELENVSIIAGGKKTEQKPQAPPENFQLFFKQQLASSMRINYKQFNTKNIDVLNNNWKLLTTTSPNINNIKQFFYNIFYLFYETNPNNGIINSLGLQAMFDNIKDNYKFTNDGIQYIRFYIKNNKYQFSSSDILSYNQLYNYNI